MSKEFKESTPKTSGSINLELNHWKFLETVNASAYIRWHLDNDPRCQKFIKGLIKEEYGGSN